MVTFGEQLSKNLQSFLAFLKQCSKFRDFFDLANNAKIKPSHLKVNPQYLTFNIEYQYGGYSKFKLRNDIFEKFVYRISIWLIFDIQYTISI